MALFPLSPSPVEGPPQAHLWPTPDQFPPLLHIIVSHRLPLGLLCVLGYKSSCFLGEKVWSWGPTWPPLSPQALTCSYHVQRGAHGCSPRNVADEGSPQPLISTEAGGKGMCVRGRGGDMSSQLCNLERTLPQLWGKPQQ